MKHFAFTGEAWKDKAVFHCSPHSPSIQDWRREAWQHISTSGARKDAQVQEGNVPLELLQAETFWETNHSPSGQDLYPSTGI